MGKTPIKINSLIPCLDAYPRKESALELKRGFTEGFHLQYNGPRIHNMSKNLRSASEHYEHVMDKVGKEISMGRIMGPFQERPISNLHISPVGVVPKTDGGWRMIMHLSYPKYEIIDPEVCSVHYSSFDNVVDMISSLGKGALLGKVHVKSAFRLIPVHQSDFELLGFFN